MIQAIIDSVFNYGKALSAIPKMKLWKYVFIPVIISILTGGFIFLGAFKAAGALDGFLLNKYPFEFGRSVFEKIVHFSGSLVVVSVGFILYKNMIMVFSSPFMSILSEKVEKAMTGETNFRVSKGRFIADLIRGLRIALRNIFRELSITVFLLLIGLIPGVSFISAPLIFLVQGYYAGFGNMDFTLERHMGYKESIHFVKRNRGIAIGNGVVFLGLLFLGIGFLIAPSLGTIASTMGTVKRLNEE